MQLVLFFSGCKHDEPLTTRVFQRKPLTSSAQPYRQTADNEGVAAKTMYNFVQAYHQGLLQNCLGEPIHRSSPKSPFKTSNNRLTRELTHFDNARLLIMSPTVFGPHGRRHLPTFAVLRPPFLKIFRKLYCGTQRTLDFLHVHHCGQLFSKF